MSAESRDMREAGRADAVRDIADGLVVPSGEALDAARAFVAEGGRQSARYWVAYYNVVKGAERDAR